MFKIKTMNKITHLGLDLFGKDNYLIDDGDENFDAAIVRSAILHETAFPSTLKCIARAGAGYNNIPTDKCAEQGIVVFNTPGANANAVKELAVAALILACRDIIGGVNWAKTLTENVAKEVESGKSQFSSREISGKTLGIIGVGAVGRLVANAAVALGMEVYGHDPYMTVDSALALSRSFKNAPNKKTIYEKADYICLHALVTPETKNSVNAEAIAQMKDGVVIINMARAELVNDDDMAAALESGKVARYVTDFPNEKVLKMKNTIAIPHLGASTPESEDTCAVMAANQIIDYLENGNIKNSVNYPDMVIERAAESRICILHKNIPHMISQISSAVSEMHINIENMANRSKGDYAYTMIELNRKDNADIVEKIAKIEGIIKINVI